MSENSTAVTVSLSGRGALGVWHGVAAGAEARVDDWYNTEHHRERVELPGFLRARRYLNLGDGPRYFSRYDVAEVSVLGSDAYRAALDRPSPRSREIFPLYRDTVRGAFAVIARAGLADGGALLSLRFPQAVPEGELRAAIPATLACPGVLRTELWRVDPAITTIRSDEKALRERDEAFPGFALLVDLNEPAQIDGCLAALPAPLRDAAQVDRMQLAFCLNRSPELIGQALTGAAPQPGERAS